MVEHTATAAWAAVAASGGAVAMGVWIAARSFGAASLPGCGAHSACDSVANGRWSRLGALPVAPLGAAVYVALLVGVLARASASPPGCGPTVTAATTVAALLAIGAACWFVGLQLVVIRRVCFYCVGAHLCACAAGGLFLAAATPWAGPTWPTEVMVALAGVLALVVGQLALVPQTFAVVPVSTPSAEPPLNATPAPASPTRGWAPAPAARVRSRAMPGAPAPTPRQSTLLGGGVVLNVGGWPMLGRPDARHVLAALFDFTCGECHHLHRLLAEAVEARPDWLAISLVPVPMHPACNPTVTCTRDAGLQACDYARLAWAVWLAGGAERYAAWDAYVFGDPGAVRPYGLSLIRGGELTDLTGFRLRGNDDQKLANSVAAGVGLYRAAGKPTVPAVLLPAGLLRGHMPDLPALLRLLDSHLPSGREPLTGSGTT